MEEGCHMPLFLFWCSPCCTGQMSPIFPSFRLRLLIYKYWLLKYVQLLGLAQILISYYDSTCTMFYYSPGGQETSPHIWDWKLAEPSTLQWTPLLLWSGHVHCLFLVWVAPPQVTAHLSQLFQGPQMPSTLKSIVYIEKYLTNVFRIIYNSLKSC